VLPCWNFWATALWKWTFCTLLQSELVRPLNTKNVSNNFLELLTKIWNFWGTGLSVMNFWPELPVLPYCILNSSFWVLICVCNYFTDGCPWVCCGECDGSFATTGLQWEGFTRIAWRALCAVGYTTPPFYEGVEYEELGVPSCRVRVTVLPHPGHLEWADLVWQPTQENTVLSLKTDPLWSLSNSKVSSCH
jgi:hypothetical protein